MPVELPPPALPEAVRSLVGDSARLAVLRGLQLAEAPPDDPDLDRLAKLGASLLDAPLALLTVLDEEIQHFKAAFGTERREAPVETSFCVHALAGSDVMVVEDAAADPRFRQNPFVAGPPFVRFYLGAPVCVSGQKVGTLCVYDVRPRPHPGEATVAQLQALAELAGSFLLLKDSSRAGLVARAALAREEKRRGIALEAASLASWVWNVDSHIVECDPLLPELFGMATTTRLHARRLFAAIDPRDLRASRLRFRQALETDGEYLDEFRVAGSHPPRWLAARGRVVERDASGRPTLLFGVNFDASERRGTEERQRLLLRELNHRVKNTLATVQALASQTVRHSGNARDFLQAFSARLQALGGAHNLLSEREWKGIGLAELVAMETKPFQEATSRLDVKGEDVMLPPDQAMGLGLILHELGSNALKYGALSVEPGRVTIAWRLETRENGVRFLVLDWRESGGPAVVPPRAHGFGTILIRRSLAKVLGSQVDHHFLPSGVEAAVVMPLTEAEPLWLGGGVR